MLKQIIRLQILLLGAVTISLAPARAATVLRLKNGDRISGEVMQQTEERIHFRSPILGEIFVLKTDATVVNEPDTPVESLAGIAPVAHSPTPTQTPEPKPASSIGPGEKTAEAPKRDWRAKVEFGFFQQTGRRDLMTFSTRLDAEHQKGPNDSKFIARMLYGEQDEKISSERYDASARYRRELSKRTFGQSLTSYTTDRVKKIDINFEENLGAGFRMFKSKTHSANLGLGTTMRMREANGVEEGTSFLGEFFQDYTYRLNGRLSFLQDTNVLYTPRPTSNGERDVTNFRFRFNTALQGKMTERVSLNLRYEYEYDNTAPFDAEKRDQRITSSIGYAL